MEWGTEIDRFGWEEKELEGECEMGLLLPWLLEKEGLRDLAKDSSCESDCDCESDLHGRFPGISEKPSAD